MNVAMANNNQGAVPCTPPTPSPKSIGIQPKQQRLVDNDVITSASSLHALNLKLQLKVDELERENARLREQVAKAGVFDTLSRDLAFLRVQLDKTSVCLVKKCEANDILKKELEQLKEKFKLTPNTSEAHKPKKKALTVLESNIGGLRKLMVYSDDDSSSESECSTPRRPNRPSMGSCGNISEDILKQEKVPKCLNKMYADAPLRHKVLLRVHSMKSASTESLESVGRKSIRKQEESDVRNKVVHPPKMQNRVKPTVGKPLPLTVKDNVVKPPARPRAALGEFTNSRTIHVQPANKGIKRSKTTAATTSRPIFRF